MATAKVGGDGTFRAPVLPLPGLRLGPTNVTGTTLGGVTAAAPYLLLSGTFQPQGRARDLVARR